MPKTIDKTVCLFSCEGVTKCAYKSVNSDKTAVLTYPSEKIKLVATGESLGDEECARFASSSPGGTMEFNVANKDVHGFFEPGEYYYITITKAEHPADRLLRKAAEEKAQAGSTVGE